MASTGVLSMAKTPAARPAPAATISTRKRLRMQNSMIRFDHGRLPAWVSCWEAGQPPPPYQRRPGRLHSRPTWEPALDLYPCRLPSRPALPGSSSRAWRLAFSIASSPQHRKHGHRLALDHAASPAGPIEPQPVAPRRMTGHEPCWLSASRRSSGAELRQVWPAPSRPRRCPRPPAWRAGRRTPAAALAAAAAEVDGAGGRVEPRLGVDQERAVGDHPVAGLQAATAPGRRRWGRPASPSAAPAGRPRPRRRPGDASR